MYDFLLLAYLPVSIMGTWDENQLRRSEIDLDPINRNAAAEPHYNVEQDVSDEDLPVKKHRDSLMKLITENSVVVVCGETGSGKSTQIPQFMAQDGLVSSKNKLAIAQPRRIAASSLATRVSQEMGVHLGSEVGYTVRFENKSSAKTIIKYVTNGMLIREVLVDPRLSEYGALLIDEAHERTVETDVMLGLIRQMLQHRSDFKVVISSATLDANKLADYFGGAPIYVVPGRKFPVNILYKILNSTPIKSSKELVTQTICQIHTQEPLDGDILVFLPGQSDIEEVDEELSVCIEEWGSKFAELIVIPVFANMASDMQARIFHKTPRNCRKVVLATNIAETSLTIPQIKYVVDTGFVKQQAYNPQSAMDTLETVRISQASAEQRAGRAGRTGPGVCYRLYSKMEFNSKFQKQTEPEILRANLSQVCLLLLSLGVEDLLSFPWVDSPTSESIVHALQLLYALGAVNQQASLTKLGRVLAEFPVDPKLAKTLVSGFLLGCKHDVATAAAMLGEMGSLFILPKGRKPQAQLAHEQLKVEGGDHTTLVFIYQQWAKSNYSRQWCRDYYLNVKSLQKARSVRDQLLHLIGRVAPNLNNFTVLNSALNHSSSNDSPLIQALVSGYFLHSARLSKNNQDYIGYNVGTPMSIHPSSTLWGTKPLPKSIIYHELVLTTKAYIRGCLVVDLGTVRKVAPHFFFEKLAK